MDNFSWVYLLTNYKFLYFINDLKNIFEEPSLYRFPYKYVTIPPIIVYKKKCYLIKPSIDYLISKHGLSEIINREDLLKFLFLFILSSEKNIFVLQKNNHFLHVVLKWYNFLTHYFYNKGKKYDCFDLIIFLFVFLQDFYVKDDKLLEDLIDDFENSLSNKNEVFSFVCILISLLLQTYDKNFDDFIDNSVSVLFFSLINKSAFLDAFAHSKFQTEINDDFNKIINKSYLLSYLKDATIKGFQKETPPIINTSIIIKFHEFVSNRINKRLHVQGGVHQETKILFDLLLYILILIVLSHKYTNKKTHNNSFVIQNGHNDAPLNKVISINNTIHISDNNDSKVYNNIKKVKKDDIYTDICVNSIEKTYSTIIDKDLSYNIKDLLSWIPKYIENKYIVDEYQQKIKNRLINLIANTYNIISKSYEFYFSSHKYSNIVFYEPNNKKIYFMVPCYELLNMNLNINSIRKYSKKFVEFIDDFVRKR